MGKAIRASALILLMACSAQAGYMGNGSPEPPPPPPSNAVVEEETADGDIQNGIIDIFLDVALNLLTGGGSLL
jgi:hypothetical protein